MPTVLTNVHQVPPGAVAFEANVRIGKSFHLVLPYGSTFRPLVFLSLRPDGTIVCGPAYRRDRVLRTARRRGSSLPLPHRLRRAIKAGEQPLPTNFHFSYHTSGIINADPMPRTFRAALSQTEPHQLARFLFEHPGYLPLGKVRSRDVVLPLHVHDSVALQGKLLTIPVDSVAFFTDVSEQAAFAFNALNSENAVQYRIQFSMLAADDPWPQQTTIEWVSQDPDVRGHHG